MHFCEDYQMLVIFGGRIDFVTRKYGNSAILNDVWVLHLEPELMWSQVHCTGSIPRERFSHTSCVIGTQLVIFGGLNDENFQSSGELYALELDPYHAVRLGNEENKRLQE